MQIEDRNHGHLSVATAALLLSGGNATVALLSLLRNVLIARLISVEDFGIASTFAIAMAVFEMTSNIGLDRMLVQAKDGARPTFQRTAHAIIAVRGIIGAAVLFLLADAIAVLFQSPGIAWAYQVLAIVPLLRSIVHTDALLLQRDMRFKRSMAVEVTAQTVGTVAGVGLALYLNDFRAMLYALILQQLAATIGSHFVAQRPYRWAWEREIARRIVAFGWPLFFNGLLIFGTFHGDRIIVGSEIGLAELGWFSAAFAMTIAPTGVTNRTLQSFFLPQLAAAQDTHERFESLHRVTLQACALAGISISTLIALVGPVVLVFLYGDKYQPALTVLVLLGVMHGVRVLRQGPSIVAMAKARTTNPLISNVVRLTALPIAWAAVKMGASLPDVVVIGIMGEIASQVVALILLRRVIGLPVETCIGVYLIAMTCMALIAFAAYTATPSHELFGGFTVPNLLSLVCIGFALWATGSFRRWFAQSWAQR